jgi:hypothetical protein
VKRLGCAGMVDASRSRFRLPVVAFVGVGLVAVLAYRRRMFNRRAAEFHQRYG